MQSRDTAKEVSERSEWGEIDYTNGVDFQQRDVEAVADEEVYAKDLERVWEGLLEQMVSADMRDKKESSAPEMKCRR